MGGNQNLSVQSRASGSAPIIDCGRASFRFSPSRCCDLACGNETMVYNTHRWLHASRPAGHFPADCGSRLRW